VQPEYHDQLTNQHSAFYRPDALPVTVLYGLQSLLRCAHLFAIFDRNLAKIVAPPSDECENYVALPKKNAANHVEIGL